MVKMLEQSLIEELLTVTNGEIALANNESSRRRAWDRFFRSPLQEGGAESVIEHEKTVLQFRGDFFSLDRLELMLEEMARCGPYAPRIALIHAEVASMGHRFIDARRHLEQAQSDLALSAEAAKLRLTIDQACGLNVDAVLRERHRSARAAGRMQDFVALGALLADLGDFAEADACYQQAIRRYREASPFPIAWVWFQRGVLWGELMPDTRPDVAERFYRRAVDLLPGFVRAHVHLAEILISHERFEEAEATLLPVVESCDAEAHWRLSDALVAQGRSAEAAVRLKTAHDLFDLCLTHHLLAFADHGAAFFADSGADNHRAVELAKVNVANRPTLRACEQAYAITIEAGDRTAASGILAQSRQLWGNTRAFQLSKLAGDLAG